MKKKIIVERVSFLFLISLFMLVWFPLQKASLQTVFSNKNENLQAFGWLNDEYTGLIVGIDVSKSKMQELERLIFDEGGIVSDTISSGESIHAFTIKVPAIHAPLVAEKLQKNALVKYVEPNSRMKAFFVPNDPFWSFQWGAKKIEVDFAWNTTMGSSDILVAIIDTGVDYLHGDLVANYVSLGYDWVNNDADPMDDNGHGTHCAGIVAAEINNHVGIAGLAQVRIMAEKVLGSDGWGYYSWIAQGIYHAVDAGAKIISMSFGGHSDSQTLHDAIKYAYEHEVLLIAAAGNDGTEIKSYPAAYEEVIAVSATDSLDNMAPFSTYGDWIDLSAPGVDIYSTLLGNSYGYMSGTSMACPHVAGVAALTWSLFANYTRNEISRVLRFTADDLGEIGFDPYFGYGRVDARKALFGIPNHEVAITGWCYPTRCNPSQLSTFNATISNYGRSNETNLIVEFYVNETLIDSKTIDFLGVDASALVIFVWSTSITGSYNVTCRVLPVAGENITINNVVSSHVLVRFAMTLRVPDDYPTIKEALNSAGDDDTILVSEGVYAEGQIDILKNNVTLVANGHVILDGSLGGFVLNIRANYVLIEGFDIQKGVNYGVNMKGYGNTLTKNTINCAQGIHVYNSYNSVISLNNITKSGGNGLVLEYCSNNTVTKNRLVASSYFGGINIWHSSQNLITLNTITGGIKRGALHFYYSQNNTIAYNNITGNSYGLVLAASPYNVLRGNVMFNNTRNFCVWKEDNVLAYPWQAINDVDASNKVDGKPVYYWVDVHDAVIPSDAGCVVLVHCRNIKVENLTLKNNLDGILLVDSSNIKISRNSITANTGYPWELTCGGIVALHGSSNNIITLNNITFNEQGIIIIEGSNNTLSQNYVTKNKMWGIELLSSHNTVSLNNITNNDSGVNLAGGSVNTLIRNNITFNVKYGLWLQGSNHNVSSNNIVANGYGIAIIASDSIIEANNIIASKDYGLWICEASNNRLFHNNFINNTVQVYTYESINIWDNGYPSGGNYWSDYSGTDTNNDGIGDTPYIIDADNQDRYPLMKSYAPLIGDLNGDRKVDMKDIAIVASAFGAYPQHPKWNPIADINKDGKIDMWDIAIVAKNFGKTS